MTEPQTGSIQLDRAVDSLIVGTRHRADLGDIEALAMHWDVVEQRAHEFGKQAHRDNWRVVGLMHLADSRAQALADVRHGIREFCDYLQHTAAAPQMQVTGNSIDEYIEWALGTGSTVIGTYEDAITHIDNLLEQKKGGFGDVRYLSHPAGRPATPPRC